jgi:Superinfection immunity protein
VLASGKAEAVLIYVYRGGSMTSLLAAFFFPIFGFGFVMYFLPSIIAFARSKRDITGIVLLNFFLGWTMIGWVVALVWAVKTDVPMVVR